MASGNVISVKDGFYSIYNKKQQNVFNSSLLFQRGQITKQGLNTMHFPRGTYQTIKDGAYINLYEFNGGHWYGTLDSLKMEITGKYTLDGGYNVINFVYQMEFIAPPLNQLLAEYKNMKLKNVEYVDLTQQQESKQDKEEINRLKKKKDRKS
eukprot:528489_1